jgi:hypothetical protein
MQVFPSPPLQQAATGALSWLSSSASAAAAVALLALPLLAVVRPFKPAQLPPAAATITTDASSRSSSNKSAAPFKQRVQPVNAQIPSEELQKLCEQLQQQLHGKVWLRENVPGLEELLPGGSTAGSTSGGTFGFLTGSTTGSTSISTSAGSSSSKAGIVCQVVVDRRGQVLGLKPCSPIAAAAFLKLPLAASLRGPDLAKVQEK